MTVIGERLNAPRRCLGVTRSAREGAADGRASAVGTVMGRSVDEPKIPIPVAQRSAASGERTRMIRWAVLIQRLSFPLDCSATHRAFQALRDRLQGHVSFLCIPLGLPPSPRSYLSKVKMVGERSLSRTAGFVSPGESRPDGERATWKLRFVARLHGELGGQARRGLQDVGVSGRFGLEGLSVR